jgi:hypothetical protein
VLLFTTSVKYEKGLCRFAYGYESPPVYPVEGMLSAYDFQVFPAVISLRTMLSRLTVPANVSSLVTNCGREHEVVTDGRVGIGEILRGEAVLRG